MEQKRVKGYVTRFTTSSKGRLVCWVRVKDESSQHNGKELVSASIHENLELAQGLNVNFVIGTVDDQNNQKALRAVDICLEPAD
jgi:hypothetical protein